MRTIRIITSVTQKLFRHFELRCWCGAMLLLFFLSEKTHETSLCIFSLLGIGHCPGCGLGHAIHHALHLRFAQSWQYHPLGIFAVIVIFSRIKTLAYYLKRKYETQPAEPDPRYRR